MVNMACHSNKCESWIIELKRIVNYLRRSQIVYKWRMALKSLYPTSCQKKKKKKASAKFYLVFEETFTQSLLTERTSWEQVKQASSINGRREIHTITMEVTAVTCNKKGKKLSQKIILRPESTDLTVKCWLLCVSRPPKSTLQKENVTDQDLSTRIESNEYTEYIHVLIQYLRDIHHSP